MPKTDPFSIRLPVEQHERLMDVAAATGGTYSKSDLISRSLEIYFALLEHCPSMLPEYDLSQDRSVTQRAVDVTQRSQAYASVSEMIAGGGR